VLLTGCQHRVKVPPLPPQAKTPSVYLPPPAANQLPPMGSQEPPAGLTDAKPAAAQEMKPKRRAHRSPSPVAPAAGDGPSPAPAPAPVATPSITPAATLGALSPGGEAADSKQQQEVLGKIAAVERRIAELPRAIADRQEKQVANVRLFLKEASDALKGGDVEGAGILATKADLLLDDISR
jgi:hypothetical protein